MFLPKCAILYSFWYHFFLLLLLLRLARESEAVEEILLREFWFSPLSNLTLMSKQTQRNLMKWRYLGVTGSQPTLYYRCTLKNKEVSKAG